MLRLFRAWRLLRTLFPLLLYGTAALALTATSRAGPRTTGRGKSSLRRLAQGVERGVSPLVSDARNDLAHALTAPRP